MTPKNVALVVVVALMLLAAISACRLTTLTFDRYKNNCPPKAISADDLNP